MQFSQIINFLLYSKFKVYALLLVPAFISFFWHLNNNQLPIADAIDYLWPAFHIYGDISRLDFYNIIHGLYFDRGWRPSIFHLFYLPFLIISKGNLLFAIGAAHTFFTLLSTYFLFKTFSIKLNDNLAALCTCTLAISSVILFGGSSVPGFTEVAFVSMFLGFIYYLSNDETFVNKRKSIYFSLLLFLLYCIRPIEALIYTFLPLIVFFFLKYKKNHISKHQILQIFNICLAGILILFVTSHFSNVEQILNSIDPPHARNLFYKLFYFFILLGIIFMLIRIFTKKKIYVENIYISSSFFIAILLITIWWLGFFNNLFEWIYRTTFGDVVTNMIIPEVSIFQHLENLIRNYSLFIFILIFSYFLFINLFLIIYKKNKFKEFISSFEIIIASSIPIPFLFYFFSVQTSFRKIAVATIMLLILMLLLSFKNIRKSYFINFSLIFTIIISSYFHGEFIFSKK